MSQQQPNRLTRGEFLWAATGTVAAAATATSLAGLPSPAAAEAETASRGAAGNDALLGRLDDKVRVGMRKYGIPGVALGMNYSDVHEGVRALYSAECVEGKFCELRPNGVPRSSPRKLPPGRCAS